MTDDYTNTIEQLKQKIPELMDTYGIHGLAFVLIRDGKVVWDDSFGLQNIERNIPVTETTLFASASIAKPVVAYLTLKLCEEGKLDLNESLQSYLAEPYLEQQPLLKQITARHVLTHTTGFPNWGETRYKPNIFFTPGERFSYSNESFIYLQAVLEEITKMNLDNLFQEYMGRKFGFKDAGFVWKTEYEDTCAFGYLRDGTNRTWKPENPSATGSLFITAKDYAKFMISLMTGQSKQSYYLNEDTIQNNLSPVVTVNDAGLSNQPAKPLNQIKLDDKVFWGLGWSLEKTGSTYNFWHWGNNGRYHNIAFANRQGSGFALFGNSEMTPFAWRETIKIAMPGNRPSLDWLNNFFEL
ncbi:MAG: beta-lactamase family protein [Asgard group archaeon]|nr:beta-lactamase family protein [Asgard group archaeon]